MSRSLNDIIKRSGFGEKMGIKLKEKKKPVGEVYSRAIVGKSSGIKIENYSLKSTINEIINYKRGLGEDGPMSVGTIGDKIGNAFKTIWDKIVEILKAIWDFITSQLGAFWDWLTGKGKESTKKAVEAKFYEISGGEVGERLALPAPNSVENSDKAGGKNSLMVKPGSNLAKNGSNMSSNVSNPNASKINNNSGMNGGSGINNNSRIGYNQNQTSRIGMNDTGKSSSKPSGGTTNSTNVSFPKIYVDEETGSAFMKALGDIIRLFEAKGENLRKATSKAKSFDARRAYEEYSKSDTKDASTIPGMVELVNVITNMVTGEDAKFENGTMKKIVGDGEEFAGNVFFNELAAKTSKALELGQLSASLDPSQAKPAYSRWKRIEKVIDNCYNRMESFKSSIEEALSVTTKSINELIRVGKDSRLNFGEQISDPVKKEMYMFMDIINKFASSLKTGMTDLGKKMKDLLVSLKPKG